MKSYISKIIRVGIILSIVLGAGYFLYVFNQVDKPQLVNTEGRTFERAGVVEIIQDNVQENGSRIGDQVVSVRLSSGTHAGEIITANCPNGMLFGTVCRPGMDVIIISSRVGALQIFTVYNIDRSWPIALYIGTFLLLLCLIGGKKGIKSAIALVFTFICFILLFFPMIMKGIGPGTAAVITSSIILTATIYLINGWTRKSCAAVISSFGGILTAAVAAVIFGYAASLSGYNVSNIEALIFVGQNSSIDVGQILFAGILFASLGAVMDIAMDVSSAIEELRKHNPHLPPGVLFAAGMSVGRDVMGTMTTTLILAFFGGALGIWVLDYAYNLPFLQLINSNDVGIQIMQGLSGSFGVIFTVPMAAALSAWLPWKNELLNGKR
jgi:uncharacterized membrane protein